jgi:large subunit ribosomal protein L17
MNHRNAHRKFSRHSSQRRALLSGLANALIKHEQIKTTLAKAKEIQPLVERLITAGKQGDLAARRQLVAFLRDNAMAEKLIAVLGKRDAERKGGYTRVLKAGFRYGDSAPMAVIELVDRDLSAKGKDSGPKQNAEAETAAVAA